MEFLTVIGLGLVGLAAGTLGGMFGIGGGSIIVPALMLLLNFSQVQANGTSLAALLLPVGILGCIEYYRAGKLKIGPALASAVGIALGIWFGAGFALGLDAQTLKQAYAVFLFYIAWRYTSPRLWWREQQGLGEVKVREETLIDVNSPLILATCVGIGAVAGVFAGLFGIGGGLVIVPLLLLLGFDQKLATGTSLGALLLPSGLPGVIRYYQAGQLGVLAAVPVALGLLVGALFGARFALGLSAKTVRRLFGIFLFLIGLRFILVA
jgi:uncharacterized membrane protein YfcA